jgi:hypothetical protein
MTTPTTNANAHTTYRMSHAVGPSQGPVSYLPPGRRETPTPMASTITVSRANAAQRRPGVRGSRRVIAFLRGSVVVVVVVVVVVLTRRLE